MPEVGSFYQDNVEKILALRGKRSFKRRLPAPGTIIHGDVPILFEVPDAGNRKPDTGIIRRPTYLFEGPDTGHPLVTEASSVGHGYRFKSLSSRHI